MSNTVSFKGYLMVDGCTEISEIRRFQIDLDVASSFIYLKEKLQCVFPNIRNKRFIVAWKDAEGDQIAISSDDELQIALTETQQCDVRKLYVTVYSEDKHDFYTNTRALEGEIHADVQCDECNRYVRGFRYKCIECADYDLCSECEAKGLHPQHFILRIAAPQQWSSHGKRLFYHIKKFVKKSVAHTHREEITRECPAGRRRSGKTKPCYDGQSWMNVFSEIHANIQCDECNRYVRQFRYKCIECADYDLCSECEAKGLHPQHLVLRIAAPTCREEITQECPVGRKRGGRAKPSYDGQSWMNVFADYINDWTNYADEYRKRNNTTKSPEQATEAEATTSETSSQKKKKEAEPHVDLIKIVEDSIAQFLNPFGIDISVQVKNDKPSKSVPCDSPKNETNAFTKQPESQTSDVKETGKHSEEEKTTFSCQHTEVSTPNFTPTNQEKPAPEKVSDDDDEWTMIDSSKSAIPAPAPSTPSAPPLVSVVPTPSTSSTTVTPVTPVTPVSSTSTPPSDATSKQVTTPSAPALENNFKPVYPSLPRTEPTFYHPNPKIQRAVETMMQMGFTNEGGWLTQLLIAKDGDIDKALDILQPVKR